MNLASILKRLDRRFRDRDNSPHRSLGAQITKRRVAVSTYWRLNSEMLPPNATGTGPHPKYDVFISYRHVARDKKTAIWLHREMESFRTPKRLVEQRGYPPRIRAFRDDEELSASHSLSKAITSALTSSKCLVVICSEHTPGSKWVNEEIEFFCSLGNAERIFSVLISGDLERSLPTVLKKIRGANTTDNSEPLAVDLRPGRLNRRLALLKLLAPVLGCDFDDLRQRDHERQMRRRNVAVAALLFILALMTALAGVAFWQYRQAVLASARNQQRLAEEYIKAGDSVSAAMLLSDLISRGVDRDGAWNALRFVGSQFRSLNEILKDGNVELPSVIFWNDEEYFVTRDLRVLRLDGIKSSGTAWSLNKVGDKLLVVTGHNHFLAFNIPSATLIFDVEVMGLGKSALHFPLAIDAESNDSWIVSAHLEAQHETDEDEEDIDQAALPTLNIRIDDRGHQNISATIATGASRTPYGLVFPEITPEDKLWSISPGREETAQKTTINDSDNQSWEEVGAVSLMDRTWRLRSGQKRFDFEEIHGTGGSTYRIAEMTSDGKLNAERTFYSRDTDASPTLDGKYIFMHAAFEKDDVNSKYELSDSVLFSLDTFAPVRGVNEGVVALFSPSYNLLATYDHDEYSAEQPAPSLHLYSRLSNASFEEIALPQNIIREPGLQADFVSDGNLLILNGRTLLLVNCKRKATQWWIRIDIPETTTNNLTFVRSDTFIAVYSDDTVELVDLRSGMIVTGPINLHDALRSSWSAPEHYSLDGRSDIPREGSQPHVDKIEIDQEGSLVVYLNTDKTLWVMRRRPPFDGYAAQRFSAHPERYTARLTDHQELPVQMLNEIQLAVDHAGRLEITNQISSSLSEQFKLKGIDFSDVENIRVTVTAEQHDIALELGSHHFSERIKVFDYHLKEWKAQFPCGVRSVDLSYDNQIIVNPDSVPCDARNLTRRANEGPK